MQVHRSFRTRPTAAFVRLDDDTGTSYFRIQPKWELAEFHGVSSEVDSPLPEVHEEPESRPPRQPFEPLPMSLVRQMQDLPPLSLDWNAPVRPRAIPHAGQQAGLLWLYDRTSNRFIREAN
jgi:hypothetical protein